MGHQPGGRALRLDSRDGQRRGSPVLSAGRGSLVVCLTLMAGGKGRTQDTWESGFGSAQNILFMLEDKRQRAMLQGQQNATISAATSGRFVNASTVAGRMPGRWFARLATR
jgi:hypothetical protein